MFIGLVKNKFLNKCSARKINLYFGYVHSERVSSLVGRYICYVHIYYSIAGYKSVKHSG